MCGWRLYHNHNIWGVSLHKKPFDLILKLEWVLFFLFFFSPLDLLGCTTACAREKIDLAIKSQMRQMEKIVDWLVLFCVTRIARIGPYLQGRDSQGSACSITGLDGAAMDGIGLDGCAFFSFNPCAPRVVWQWHV